jgi:hypothetical protein
MRRTASSPGSYLTVADGASTDESFSQAQEGYNGGGVWRR